MSYTPEIFKSPFGHAAYTLIRRKKHLKKLGIDKKLVTSSGAGAATNFITDEQGNNLIIVYMPYCDVDMNQQQGLIVHESVHVWQEIKSLMNEKEPSAEFEAYSIQVIAQQLLHLLELSNHGMEKSPDEL